MLPNEVCKLLPYGGLTAGRHRISCINSHCQVPPPRFILTDNGSSNDILENHQKSIVEVLQANVRMEILASSHQFLNLVESTIRIFKNILRSIYSGTPPTAPVNTRAELHCIFSHVANILNSRPLSSQSEDTLALNSNQLVKPYISNADQEILVSKYLEEVFNDADRHLLLSNIFQNNQSMARTASQVLKREFLENAKLFSDKPDGIKPLVGDVVLVCKDQPSLGLVMEILSPRRVVVRHKNRGANTDHEYHCKILALIFRPESSVFFISTFDKPEMPHLLEAFWSRLKQKIT